VDDLFQLATKDFFSEVVQATSPYVATVQLRVLTGTSGSTGDMYESNRVWTSGSLTTYNAAVSYYQDPAFTRQGVRSGQRQGRLIFSAAAEATTLDALTAAISLASGSSTAATRYRADLLIDGVVVTVNSVIPDPISQCLAVDFTGPDRKP